MDEKKYDNKRWSTEKVIYVDNQGFHHDTKEKAESSSLNHIQTERLRDLLNDRYRKQISKHDNKVVIEYNNEVLYQLADVMHIDLVENYEYCKRISEGVKLLNSSISKVDVAELVMRAIYSLQFLNPDALDRILKENLEHFGSRFKHIRH